MRTFQRSFWGRWGINSQQGGGIAASFAADFPHLTTGKIALIASAGLLEVRTLFFLSIFRPDAAAVRCDKHKDADIVLFFAP